MIIVEQRADYWGVWMYSVPGMPEDVEMPLPFGPQAPLAMVVNDMRRRFPGQKIKYRNRDGVTEPCYLD